MVEQEIVLHMQPSLPKDGQVVVLHTKGRFIVRRVTKNAGVGHDAKQLKVGDDAVEGFCQGQFTIDRFHPFFHNHVFLFDFLPL